MRRSTRWAAAIAGGLGMVIPLASPATASAPRLGTLIPSGPKIHLPAGNSVQYSLNWSGYAYNPGNNITAVSGTWTVPTVQNPLPGFSAEWTGIGGDGTSDLIQAGTGSDSELGGNYYAWYEILPASETQITSGCTGGAGAATCNVTPGDVTTVNINQTSNNVWTITMNVSGTDNWSWSITNLQYTSSHSSAEWILEAPTVGVQSVMDHVGNVFFGPGNTYTYNGTTANLAASNPDKIILDPDPTGLLPVAEATPSAINAAGDSFNDCSWSTTCAAP